MSCFHHIRHLKRVRRIAALQQERPRGLLLDVDVENGEFFTTQLNMTESDKLLRDKMYIYNVLMEDVG